MKWVWAFEGRIRLLVIGLLFASDSFVKTPSVEPVLRSRLLPRVSFRLVLALTTLSAVLAAVAKAAGGGVAAAWAAVVAAGFLAVSLLMFVALFLFCWAISSLWYDGQTDAGHGSPFADGQLPPQILPPREQQS